jgi:uncharacterized integral membrane protein
MKDEALTALIALSLILVTHIGVSFVFMGLNPFDWPMGARVVVATVSVFLIIVCVLSNVEPLYIREIGRHKATRSRMQCEINMINSENERVMQNLKDHWSKRDYDQHSKIISLENQVRELTKSNNLLSRAIQEKENGNI